MENIVLNARARDVKVEAKNIRQEGRVPAVAYGKGADNIFMDFDYQELRKVIEKAGHSVLVELVIDGAKPVEVLIHDVDYAPVSGNIIHVDFKLITRGVEITTEIPIIFEGVSEAIKTMAGILVTNKEFLNIKCMPRELVHDFKVDLSLLADFNCKITVADINVPETITVLNAPDEMIASVIAPRAAIESLSTDGNADETAIEEETPLAGEEEKKED